MNLQDVGYATDLIANIAKKLTIRLPADYPTQHLQKLKTLLDAAKGLTQVYLEVPSKADPTKLHQIRTNKSILVHHALLEHLENTLGEKAWRFE